MVKEIVEISGIKYLAEIGPGGKYLSPPELIYEESLPTEICINLLNESSKILFPYYRILNKWLKDNKIADLLFSKELITVNHQNLDMIQAIVESDSEDENSPLTDEVGKVLLSLINELRRRLKSAS